MTILIMDSYFSVDAKKLEGSIPPLIHISSCFIICSENREEKEYPSIDTVLFAKKKVIIFKNSYL